MTKVKLQVKHDQHAINPLEWNDTEMHKQTKKPAGYDTTLPLYKYEHSGVAYSTEPFNNRWDSGRVGWVTSNRLDKDTLKSFINGEYTDWCNGEVFTLILLQSDTCHCCEHTEWERTDSVGGIYITQNRSWKEKAHKLFNVKEIDEIEPPF